MHMMAKIIKEIFKRLRFKYNTALLDYIQLKNYEILIQNSI